MSLKVKQKPIMLEIIEPLISCIIINFPNIQEKVLPSTCSYRSEIKIQIICWRFASGYTMDLVLRILRQLGLK